VIAETIIFLSIWMITVVSLIIRIEWEYIKYSEKQLGVTRHRK